MQEDPICKKPSTFPLFSKYLPLQPMTAINFANESKKQFEEFAEAFRRRIVVELQYADNLDMVSKSLDRFIQPGSEKAISFISSAFKVEHEQRARQARQLSSSLSTQVYDICMNSCKQHGNLIKSVQKQVKNLLKKFQILNQDFEQNYEEYEKVSTQLEEFVITRHFMKHTSSIPVEKKAKLISKTSSNISQRRQTERKLITSTNNYNTFVEEYNKSIVEHLNQIQTQIREQIILEADSLRKLIVGEVSMFKNIQYDLINISKQMEALNTQKDLDIFTEEAKNSTKNLIIDQNPSKKLTESTKQKRKSMTPFLSDPTGNEVCLANLLQPRQNRISKGIMYNCLNTSEKGLFTQMLINKKSKSFKKLIQARWNELTANAETKQCAIKSETEASIIQNSQKKTTDPIHSQNGKERENGHKQNLKEIFYLYFEESFFGKDFIKDKKQEEKDDIINEVYENFIIITRYIHELWNGKSITPVENKQKNKGTEKLNESTFSFIKKLLSANHFYRLICYCLIQNFQNYHLILIQNPKRVEEISKLLNCLITKSTKEADVFVLRGILSLIFTFYYIDNNLKKHMSAEPSIYKNSLWKKQEFWDAAIFQSTFEEMHSFGPQEDETLLETVLRQKNLIFSQLASYCHYMTMMGINSKNVRQIVGRFCRLYDMNDEQNRDLSKMITNTVKQYKEVFSSQVKET